MTATWQLGDLHAAGFSGSGLREYPTWAISGVWVEVGYCYPEAKLPVFAQPSWLWEPVAHLELTTPVIILHRHLQVSQQQTQAHHYRLTEDDRQRTLLKGSLCLVTPPQFRLLERERLSRSTSCHLASPRSSAFQTPSQSQQVNRYNQILQFGKQATRSW
jgi:hypothetical protein